MPETIENQADDLLKGFIDESKTLQKKFGVNKSEALFLMVLLGLKKVHSHLDREDPAN